MHNFIYSISYPNWCHDNFSTACTVGTCTYYSVMVIMLLFLSSTQNVDNLLFSLPLITTQAKEKNPNEIVYAELGKKPKNAPILLPFELNPVIYTEIKVGQTAILTQLTLKILHPLRNHRFLLPQPLLPAKDSSRWCMQIFKQPAVVPHLPSLPNLVCTPLSSSEALQPILPVVNNYHYLNCIWSIA